LTRDSVAQRRDIAPRRILPDAAIIDAATANPKTVDDLIALPVFGGRHQRRSAAMWFAALEAARRTEIRPTTPSRRTHRRAGAWSRRKPKPQCDWKQLGRRCRKCLSEWAFRRRT